jgi:hypothetical protein
MCGLTDIATFADHYSLGQARSATPAYRRPVYCTTLYLWFCYTRSSLTSVRLIAASTLLSTASN